MYELGWQPTHLIISNASGIENVLKPAGPEKAIGAITMHYFMMPDDPEWANDKDMVAYKTFMKKWMPNENANDETALVGYIMAGVMKDILDRCGDDFSRENLLKQATTFKDTPLPLLVPGVTYTTTPDDHTSFRQAGMYRFDGVRWAPFGEVVTVSGAK
jgi:hypothetical protein